MSDEQYDDCDFEKYVANLRRYLIPKLEKIWDENCAGFGHEERIQCITWLVDDKLLPLLLETNTFGIEFAITTPRAMRIIRDEFLATKGASCPNQPTERRFC